MIEKQTVLVLGAGASQPYGFPTGGELRQLICDDSSWHDAALRDHISAQFINRFVMRFRDAPQSTVDRFLAHHTDFVNVGKLAIASILIAREAASNLSPQKDNWYGYLWSRLETDWDDFSKNKLKIITFNYDRSLEQFLLQSECSHVI